MPDLTCFLHTTPHFQDLQYAFTHFSLLRHYVSINHRPLLLSYRPRKPRLAQIERMESIIGADAWPDRKCLVHTSLQLNLLPHASPSSRCFATEISSQLPAGILMSHTRHEFPTSVLLRPTPFEELVPVTVIVFSLCATLESILTPAFNAPCIFPIMASIAVAILPSATPSFLPLRHQASNKHRRWCFFTNDNGDCWFRSERMEKHSCVPSGMRRIFDALCIQHHNTNVLNTLSPSSRYFDNKSARSSQLPFMSTIDMFRPCLLW